MPAHGKYKAEFCKIAQEVLSKGESLAAICCELDITRTTLYEWRDSIPEFKAAIEKGLQHAQRYWENLGNQGVTGEIERFGGAPWIFTMKNRFRDDYKEDKEIKPLAESLLEKLIDKVVD